MKSFLDDLPLGAAGKGGEKPPARETRLAVKNVCELT